MQTLLKTRLIDVTLVQPLVQGRTGEIRVTLTNRGGRSLPAGVLRVQEAGGRDPARFAVVPPYEDGGYRLDEVPAEGTVARSFCLRPVDAEVGADTDFEVSFESPDGPVLRELFVARIEARSEVYAAIGAVAWLRERLLAAYDELEETGRRAHESMGGTWPANDAADPARVVLGEESFRRVFELVQLGARIIDGVAKKTPGDASS